MEISIDVNTFTCVTADINPDNDGSASDEVIFNIKTQLPMIVDGKDVDDLTFTVRGTLEISGLLEAMSELQRVNKRHK